MTRFTIITLLALLAGAAVGQEPEQALDRWHLNLSLVTQDLEFVPTSPYALNPGEAVSVDGDMDGTLTGVTIGGEWEGDLTLGIDLTLLTGDLNGSATYSGTFAGQTSLDMDVTRFDLRLRLEPVSWRGDVLTPYATLTVSSRRTETRESGVVTYTPVALALPQDRNHDATTTLLIPGVGLRGTWELGAATVGLQGELGLAVGNHSARTTEGPAPDDGSTIGYQLELQGFATWPLGDGWSLTTAVGLRHEDWTSNYSELDQATSVFLSIGVSHAF